MKFKYCPRCGEKLILQEIGDEGLVPYCNSCNKRYLEVPKISVIVVVLNEEDEVALLRHYYVSKTNWVLVAGYVKSGENAEETVYREVNEETGVSVNGCKYITSYYYDKKDLLLLGYVAHVEKSEFNISKEVNEAKWFSIEEANRLLRKGSTGEKHFNNVKDYLGIGI